MKTQSVRDAYIAGIEEQAHLGAKANTWCSMLELAGLSSVLGRPVHSVYPKSFPLANHEFMNVTYKPREQDTKRLVEDLAIMWSCMSKKRPDRMQCPNHFVPLVRMISSTPLPARCIGPGDNRNNSCETPKKRKSCRLSPPPEQSQHKKCAQQDMFSYFTKNEPVQITIPASNLPLSATPCSLAAESASQEAEKPYCNSGEVALRTATVATVQRWQRESDKDCETATWLKYECQGNQVTALSCSVCIEFEDKIKGSKNFSRAFIDGSRNLRASAYKDHFRSLMHEHAMILFKKKQGKSPREYAPEQEKLFSVPVMDSGTKAMMKMKFDNAYFLVKEKLAFSKFKPLCDLEIQHGVDLGQKYLNDHGCATFVHFIAEDLRGQLLSVLSKAHFFSIQVDGTTDAGNMEEELFLVVYFQPNYTSSQLGNHEVLYTGESLYECLQRALDFVGVKNWKSRLIGLGCDGAAANMSVARGMHHFLKEAVPWVAVSWCLAHRLELSIKDALKSTFFTKIDELLLQVYFMYEKSPKKCRELQLRACLEDADKDTDIPKAGGLRPLRASGTRFLSHKIAALARLIDCYIWSVHQSSHNLESAGEQRSRASASAWLCPEVE